MNKKKKQLYIAFLIFLTTTIFALGVLLFFGVGQLSKFKQEHISAKLALSEIEQKTDLQQELLADFAKVSKGSADIEASLLNPTDAAIFIEDLEGIAVSAQIELSLEAVEDNKRIAAGASGPQALIFKTELKGDFLDVLSFLRRVDALPLLVTFDDINIRAASTNGVIANITVRVFTK